MTPRVLVSLAGFALLIAAATECSNGTGVKPPPPPPPPPPPGAPVVEAGSNGTLPAGTAFGLSATFSDTTSNSAPWSYSIDWGDGANASGNKSTIAPITAAHTYGAEGHYTVTVSVTNRGGKTGSGSLTVNATAPVIVTAGDIGDCARSGDNATGAVVDTIPGIVMPLGDNAYLNGTDSEYVHCFDPAWGGAKARMKPVAGNHDYYTPAAAGYFGYFGSAAGEPSRGYYDFVVGNWLVIVLNTGTEHPADYAAGSPQELWLKNELATHTQPCTVALWHHPRFSTVLNRDSIHSNLDALWDDLYQAGAELVLNGHDHAYQRFAPQQPDGTRDAAYGIRQIAVGTGGGEGLYDFAPLPQGSNLEVRNNDTFGVLKLTLHANGYDWRFIPAAAYKTGGGAFTDSGSGTCHGRPQ